MSLMGRNPFVRCAQQYAEYWSRNERPLHDALARGDRAERLQAVQLGAGYFKVARNFPTSFDVDRGLERLAPVHDALERYRSAQLTEGDVCWAVAKLRAEFGAPYGGGDRLSAATKLLWLMHRAPVIIYDSQARAALGARSGDYNDYVELWRKLYAGCQDAVVEACAVLECGGDREHSSPSVADQEWFLQRVFDVYLWRVGAPR